MHPSFNTHCHLLQWWIYSSILTPLIQFDQFCSFHRAHKPWRLTIRKTRWITVGANASLIIETFVIAVFVLSLSLVNCLLYKQSGADCKKPGVLSGGRISACVMSWFCPQKASAEFKFTSAFLLCLSAPLCWQQKIGNNESNTSFWQLGHFNTLIRYSSKWNRLICCWTAIRINWITTQQSIATLDLLFRTFSHEQRSWRNSPAAVSVVSEVCVVGSGLPASLCSWALSWLPTIKMSSSRFLAMPSVSSS